MLDVTVGGDALKFLDGARGCDPVRPDVSFIEVADDGRTVAATDTAFSLETRHVGGRMDIWRGTQSGAFSDSVGTPCRVPFETSRYVSSHLACIPRFETRFDARGSGCEKCGKAEVRLDWQSLIEAGTRVPVRDP